MTIKEITARKIFASLGNETIEATVRFSDRIFSASVPAGISAGKYEIRKSSVDQALLEINKINVLCQGRDWSQESLDKEIGSYGFGGNSTLAVSAAFFKSQLKEKWYPSFPKLMMLAFEGGEHGNKNITIQEFLVIEGTLVQAEKDFQNLRDYLSHQNIDTTVGAEGGFSPAKFDNDMALTILARVFPDRKLALDVAGSFSTDRALKLPEMLSKYNISSIEDPFDDESWSQWTAFAKLNDGKILVVADDLTATNPKRIQEAIDRGAASGVIIKPNQIGTISQALTAAKLTHDAGLKVIVSHRGEDTDDTWIVDFALTAQADFVKFGGFDRGERVAKYNRLSELGMV